ncbi:unnamed protein product [Nezara viridula]|uniref:MADF domain-containing protein n=1 Tax=Nezara viridula TaxID=85310 RepID=A0A9P0HHV9_NEZVI|nr:unnamed protein product [Nezara viridula]
MTSIKDLNASVMRSYRARLAARSLASGFQAGSECLASRGGKSTAGWGRDASCQTNRPCLWNGESEDYTNSNKRQRAWEDLVKFSKKINPSADVSWVKKKVHTIRGSFRKEMKKVTLSSNSLDGEDGLYKPKLWYYEHLLFTKGKEKQRKSKNSVEEREEELVEDSSNVSVEYAFPVENMIFAKDNLKKRKITWENDEADEQTDDIPSLLRKASLALDSKDDEYDSHGKTIAAKLRRIASANYDQFLMADNLLNQVLFKGLKNQLTVSTTITDANRRWPVQHNPVENQTGSSPSSMYSMQSPSSPAAQDVDSHAAEVEEGS